jgi:hypothetical protein
MPRSRTTKVGVPDPTDPQGTRRPEEDPVPEAPNVQFIPLKTPPFEPQLQLPPHTNRHNAYAIWSLFFTEDILQGIIDTTN